MVIQAEMLLSLSGILGWWISYLQLFKRTLTVRDSGPQASLCIDGNTEGHGGYHLVAEWFPPMLTDWPGPGAKYELVLEQKKFASP